MEATRPVTNTTSDLSASRRARCREAQIIIIIIIYLLKQEDAHMINTRTRAGQERHRKLALTFCPSKKKKKQTHSI